MALLSWKEVWEYNPESSDHVGLEEAFEAQEQIGWKAFLEGYLSILWWEIQHKYYQPLGSHMSGKRWTIALIQKAWNVAGDQWEH